MNSERFSRQIMIEEIGKEGQTRINAASVLIIGLGGLGSPVATYLTGAGIGRIGLCDPDIVSESNLHRQIIYDTPFIGKRKTDCASKRLKELSPDTLFDIYPEGINNDNASKIISDYDIVVDCCDNYATRYMIDDTCLELGKSWIHGAIGEFTGQLCVMNGKGGTKYTDLFPDREYFCSLPRNEKGAFGPVAGTIGSLQASEVIKQIVGIPSPLDGNLMIIDFLNLSTQLIKIR